jgi:hypothetical protein
LIHDNDTNIQITFTYEEGFGKFIFLWTHLIEGAT